MSHFAEDGSHLMRRAVPTVTLLVLVVGTLLAVAWIVRAVAVARASARLEARMTALRDSGDPVYFADLQVKVIPPEQSGTTYLRRAAEAVRAIDQELSDAYLRHSETDQDAIDRGRLPESMMLAVRAAFEAHRTLMPLLEQAAASVGYEPQGDLKSSGIAFNGANSEVRSVVRVLNYRAQLLICEGKCDEAIETSVLMFRLSRHFDHEPTMVGYLVSLACRDAAGNALNKALRGAPVSDASRDAIETELARHDLVASYLEAIKTERVLGMEMLRAIFCDDDVNPVLTWLWPVRYKVNQCDYLDFLALTASLAARPYNEAAPKLDRPGASFSVTAIAPAMTATYFTNCRSQAILRSLRILNALHHFEQSHPETEPALADLGLPGEVTIDPFDNNPLRLKELTNGWLIYSVGRNLNDDGGNLLDLEDIGIGPIEPPQH